MRSIALTVAGLVASVVVLTAQDIEVEAALRGVTLSAGYYARVRHNPDFFNPVGGWAQRTARARRASVAVSGQLPIVVLPVLHADSPEPSYQPADIDRVFFSGPYANGTLAEFYNEISGGRLQIVGEVVAWVRTSLTRAQVVGSEWGLGEDARTGEFFAEALALADPTTDFRMFDSDGPDGIPNSGDDDGVVDAVAFEFIEVAASCGGPGIWPHRSSIRSWTDSAFVTDDPAAVGGMIVVNGYMTQSVVDCSGTEIHTSGVMAHELGHVLGLPDYRHHLGSVTPDRRRWLIGCYGLMSAGSWGCEGTPREAWLNASHMAPVAKLEMGWLAGVMDAPQGEFVEVTLDPIQTSEQLLRFPLGGTEVVLVEFRDTIGFDRVLPVSGVIAYHVDPELPVVPCSECPPYYKVYLLEADGRDDLLRAPFEGGNRGEASDVFSGRGPMRLTNASRPSSRLNDGRRSPVNIYQIRVANGQATLVYSTTPIEETRLVSALLSGAALLRAEELEFLDEGGNTNGRYDIGDLRAYLFGR